MIKIALLGASGRMGQAIDSLLGASEYRRLAAVVARWDADASTANLSEAVTAADLAIDFTHASAMPTILEALEQNPIRLVSGTTGLPCESQTRLEALSLHVAVLQDGNMSIGVQLLSLLVEKATSILSDYDIEITESHHRGKRDAPSGTAIKLATAAADGRGQDLSDVARFERHGEVPRRLGEIGFSVQRGGGIVGDHSVSLLGDADCLTLSHRALDRGLFAEGAVKAGVWLAQQPAGLYSIKDLLPKF